MPHTHIEIFTEICCVSSRTIVWVLCLVVIVVLPLSLLFVHSHIFMRQYRTLYATGTIAVTTPCNTYHRFWMSIPLLFATSSSSPPRAIIIAVSLTSQYVYLCVPVVVLFFCSVLFCCICFVCLFHRFLYWCSPLYFLYFISPTTRPHNIRIQPHTRIAYTHTTTSFRISSVESSFAWSCRVILELERNCYTRSADQLSAYFVNK